MVERRGGKGRWVAQDRLCVKDRDKPARVLDPVVVHTVGVVGTQNTARPAGDRGRRMAMRVATLFAQRCCRNIQLSRRRPDKRPQNRGVGRLVSVLASTVKPVRVMTHTQW